jgi:hypothetical protein
LQHQQDYLVDLVQLHRQLFQDLLEQLTLEVIQEHREHQEQHRVQQLVLHLAQLQHEDHREHREHREHQVALQQRLQ